MGFRAWGTPTIRSFAQKGLMGWLRTNSLTKTSRKPPVLLSPSGNQGSFICGFQAVLTLVEIRLSVTASFDSFLGSFVLPVQSDPKFSTSPLTYWVSTLFLAEQLLSESKSLFLFFFFIAFWKQPPEDAWKECHENTCSNTFLQYKTELT